MADDEHSKKREGLPQARAFHSPCRGPLWKGVGITLLVGDGDEMKMRRGGCGGSPESGGKPNLSSSSIHQVVLCCVLVSSRWKSRSSQPVLLPEY